MKKMFRAILVSILAMVLVSCGGKEERIAKHLQKAQDYFAAQDYEKARIEYKNVLQIDPKNVQARYSVGKIYEKSRNMNKAAKTYLAVVNLDPNHAKAHRDLGYLYLGAGQLDKAREHANKALKSDPNDAGILALLGTISAREKKLSEAESFAKQALAKSPNFPDAAMLLAAVYSQTNRMKDSVDVLQQAIAANPKHVALRGVLAQYYINNKESDKAVALLNEIISIQPKNLKVRTQLARYFVSIDKLDNAEETLKKSIADLPENAEPIIAYIGFLEQKRDKNTAISALQKFIQQNPDMYELKFDQAKLYKDNGEKDKATAVYQKIIAKDENGPNGLKAKDIIASDLLTDKKVDEALKLIAEVLEENSNDKDALLMRGTVALSRNDTAGAKTDFRTILKDQPDSRNVLLKLAAAYLQDNERLLAIDTVKKAVELHPNDLDSRYQLGQLLAQEKDYTSADEQFKTILSVKPKNQPVLESLFKVQFASGADKDANETAQKINELFPEKALGEYFLGLLSQKNKDLTSAEKHFQAALHKSPEGVEPMSALAKLYLSQNKTDNALELLNTVLDKNPKNIVAQNLKGEVYLSQKRFEQAIKNFNGAIAIDPKYTFPYSNLAATYVAQKNNTAAIDALKEGIKATGGEPRLTFGLASLYENIGKTDSAISEYQQIYYKNPQSLAAANNMAMLLVAYKNDSNSMDKAKKLIEPLKNSKNPAFLDTVGWVHYKSGEFDEAINALEKAVDGAPNQPLIRYHLGMAHFSKGDKQLAKSNLELAVNTDRNYKGKDEAKRKLKELVSGG